MVRKVVVFVINLFIVLTFPSTFTPGAWSNSVLAQGTPPFPPSILQQSQCAALLAADRWKVSVTLSGEGHGKGWTNELQVEAKGVIHASNKLAPINDFEIIASGGGYEEDFIPSQRGLEWVKSTRQKSHAVTDNEWDIRDLSYPGTPPTTTTGFYDVPPSRQFQLRLNEKNCSYAFGIWNGVAGTSTHKYRNSPAETLKGVGFWGFGDWPRNITIPLQFGVLHGVANSDYPDPTACQQAGRSDDIQERCRERGYQLQP